MTQALASLLATTCLLIGSASTTTDASAEGRSAARVVTTPTTVQIDENGDGVADLTKTRLFDAQGRLVVEHVRRSGGGGETAWTFFQYDETGRLLGSHVQLRATR